MNLEKMIKNSFDLHVHIGPEIIPRKFDLAGLIQVEQGRLAGVGVKNHFFPTVAMQTTVTQNENLQIVYSVVLNNYVGGLNAEVIRASAALSELPILVWLPTLHTTEFLKCNDEEIPREWLDPSVRGSLVLKKSKDIKPVEITDGEGKLTPKMFAVLKTIKDTGAILATGHISWQESELVVREAVQKYGIQKIIVTHPIYQKINMPVTMQKKLVKLGAVMEHCYSMYTIDGIPMAKIAQQIKAVGAENCILSSDVGQKFALNPSEAFAEFARLLLDEGMTEKELEMMLVENTQKLIR